MKSFVVLTLKYGLELQTAIQNLWIFLGRTEENVYFVLQFLLNNAVVKVCFFSCALL